MEMRRFLVLLLLLFPTSVIAQEGRVSYDRSIQYDFELPEGPPGRNNSRFRDMMPGGAYTAMTLVFDGTGSLMSPVPEEEDESAEAAGSEQDRRMAGFAARMRRFSTSRSDQENLVQTYTSFADGAVAETREFMTRTFLISGERERFAWRLTGEQRQFLGYSVQQAMADHEGATIEAWFTPEIPVPAGPAQFGGLPGLILVLSVDGGHTLYTATDVDLSPHGQPIEAPDDGDEVSRDEYEQIVAERLEEVRQMRAQGNQFRGRRPPF